MFRNFVWLLVTINIVIIGSFYLHQEPLAPTTLNPEQKTVLYTLWLIVSAIVYTALYGKADNIGDGASSFLGFTLIGTMIVSMLVGIMLVTDSFWSINSFLKFHSPVLCINTLGLLMTNYYCFDEPAHS